MPVAHFFPSDEGQQLLWLQNLASKFAAYATALGISAGEVTATTADLTFLIWTWQHWLPTWRSYAESATAFRDLVATGSGASPATPPPMPTFAPPADEPAEVLPGALTRIFERIGRWKTAPGYTDDIGQDLRIIGPEAPVHADPPELKLRAQGSGWAEMNFNRWEHAGIYIQSRRQGEETWAFLAIDTSRPYKDERPNLPTQPSEWREYRACWWDDSTPTLAFGPVLRVNVGS